MRALASAILFFILNLIGLGLGPWAIGLLSDLLAPTLGQESLRHAMLYLLPAMMTWSVVHFYLASRTLKRTWLTHRIIGMSFQTGTKGG